MTHDLVGAMVPVLGRASEPVFNVFDVMHHGLHEKQISNVFRWLLEKDGTHGLGDAFVRIFVEAVNCTTVPALPLTDEYWVRQEVNTSTDPEIIDIADLIIEGQSSVMVVENYSTSDGHGHGYERYLAYGKRENKTSRVVLLCQKEERHLLTGGWEGAAVVTYSELVESLYGMVGRDDAYQTAHPAAFAFIEQMYRKFERGGCQMDEKDVLGFVVAMCDTGEARRYQTQSKEAAAEQFASDLAQQARERFADGRELLQRSKDRLRNFSQDVLVPQLNESMGEAFVRKVTANYAGIYQWTINFHAPSLVSGLDEGRLQLKFGPSAWYANERDNHWKTTVDASAADYNRLFITWPDRAEIRQSLVTLEEVLSGLDPTDTRLHDDIVALLKG